MNDKDMMVDDANEDMKMVDNMMLEKKDDEMAYMLNEHLNANMGQDQEKNQENEKHERNAKMEEEHIVINHHAHDMCSKHAGHETNNVQDSKPQEISNAQETTNEPKSKTNGQVGKKRKNDKGPEIEKWRKYAKKRKICYIHPDTNEIITHIVAKCEKGTVFVRCKKKMLSFDIRSPNLLPVPARVPKKSKVEDCEPDAYHGPMEFWRTELAEGMKVDLRCNVSLNWLEAKIVQIEGDNLELHYQGWQDKYNVWAHRTNGDMRPYHAKTKAKIVLPKIIKIEPEVEKVEEKSEIVELGKTISGRIIYGKAKEIVAPPKVKVEVVEEDPMCSCCHEIEDEGLTDLLLCDGICKRAFHIGCLGYSSIPEEDTWHCSDCHASTFECFSCNERSPLGGENGVIQCSEKNCSQFYHLKCVWGNKLTKPNGRGEKAEEAVEEFKCPLHTCTICSDHISEKVYLYCRRCPKAYHTQCVPPSSRFNIFALFCRQHPEAKLPKVPLSFDSEDRAELTVSRRLKWDTLPLSLTARKRNGNVVIEDFDVPHEMLLEVGRKPPSYKTIYKNQYLTKIFQKEEDISPCECRTKCDDDCINQNMFIECFGDTKDNTRKEISNCPIGLHCSNRRLQERRYPKHKPVQSLNKGWGLRLEENVEENALITEYIGEVISEEMKCERFRKHRENHPKDLNMYIMDLGDHLYIDARFKSNTARFINHSCDPNCVLQKFTIGNKTCIGIFSIKPIMAMEELSYDYQFHTSKASDFLCFCGSANCRGTLAPGVSLNQKIVKKTAKIKRTEEKKGQLKEVKMAKEGLKRLNNTVENSIECTPGPSDGNLYYGWIHRLFLVRNVKKGYDFRARHNGWRKMKPNASMKIPSFLLNLKFVTKDEKYMPYITQ